MCPGTVPRQWMHLRHAPTVAGGAAVIDCFVIFVSVCSACRGGKVMGGWGLEFAAHMAAAKQKRPMHWPFLFGCLARPGNMSCTVEPRGNQQNKAKQNPSHQTGRGCTGSIPMLFGFSYQSCLS